jgi:HSP20 family molecular chaperone IbpA
MATEIEVKEPQEQTTERTRSGRVYRPSVDIVEGKDELLLVADMPGAKSELIDIQFEDGILSVGAKVESRYPNKAVMLLQEYGVGDFHRTFRVSEKIDASRIHAEYAWSTDRAFASKRSGEAAQDRSQGPCVKECALNVQT